MTRYQFNEVVDVHVRGVRVVGEHDQTGALTVRDDHGDDYPMPPQAAVTRIAPAEWPPQAGDLWRDRNGALHFASCYAPDYDDKEDCRGIDDSGVRVVLLPQYSDDSCEPGHRMYRPEHVNQECGPMTLVHREGRQAGGDR